MSFLLKWYFFMWLKKQADEILNLHKSLNYINKKNTFSKLQTTPEDEIKKENKTDYFKSYHSNFFQSDGVGGFNRNQHKF